MISFQPVGADYAIAKARASGFLPVPGLLKRPQVPLVFGADSFERKQNILLPSGTPFFMLHGTSVTGEWLSPVLQWFRRDVRSQHPGYVSYLPEVQYASGIDTVEDPVHDVPSSLMAIRDMGDFRFQVINQRLEALKATIHPETGSVEQRLGDFFSIRPADRAWLVPVLQRALVSPLFQVPAGWPREYRQPLVTMIGAGVGKLHRELAKLNLRPDEWDMPIYDTEFLNGKAHLEGKRSNFDMDNLAYHPETINIRSIHLQEIAMAESYLMRVEAELAEALQQAKQPPLSQREAALLSEKLMEAVAPRMVTLGHSQGGTVLMASLMNYLKAAPQTAADLGKPDPRQWQWLGGRAIGMQLLLSAPLKGIPEMPAWGLPLLREVNKFESRIPILRRKPGRLARWIQRFIWFTRTHKKQAVKEMRAESDLMKRFEMELPNLAGKGITVISAFDRNDIYVEPRASRLLDADGQHPDNVFNLEMETEQLPPHYTKPDDLLASLTGMIPRLGPFIIKHLPESWKQRLQTFYENDLVHVEQHRALITMPEAISQEFARLLVGTPQNQTQLLNPGNFEPLRYQSLIARSRSLQRKCFDLPLPQAAEAWQAFTQKHPGFLEGLIENARTPLPVTNSAASVSAELLDRVTTLLTAMAEDARLKRQYDGLLKTQLQLVSAKK